MTVTYRRVFGLVMGECTLGTRCPVTPCLPAIPSTGCFPVRAKPGHASLVTYFEKNLLGKRSEEAVLGG